MNPIQGDPDFVASQAHEMQTTATTLDQAAHKLQGLSHGGSHSKAMNELSAAITELASVLTSAHERYKPAGDALAAFAPELRQAMTAVNGAISATGHTDVGTAQNHLDQAFTHELLVSANPLSNQHDKDEAHHALQVATRHLDDQKTALTHAQNHYETALHDLHMAAQRARDQISDGIKDSDLNDKFSDHVHSILGHLRDILSAALAALHTILSALSTILGIMTVILTVCGFPHLAVITGGLAIIATGLDLGVQMARYQMGDITFGQFMSSLILSTVGLVLAAVGMKPLSHLPLTGPEVAKAIGQEAGFDSVSTGTEDPFAQWIDSQDGLPPHVITYSDVDPKQIAEQDGIDVPGRIRVVQPAPVTPLVVTTGGSQQTLTVAPPEQYQGQLSVYSSSQP